MNLPTSVSHYFAREVGPLLSICDLDASERSRIIRRERDAETGFNRFSRGEALFDFRLLADDLLMEVYESTFGKRPARRPFYAVLGDADVVGGLFRDPYKIRIPVDAFAPEELTFMCPDHFHLVSWMKRGEGMKKFGYQLPEGYTESEFPYFGKLMTYHELRDRLEELKIDRYLETGRRENHWYRYVEAQIWSDPELLRAKFSEWIEVEPEPWTLNGVTHLQNYKTLKAAQGGHDRGE